MLYCTARVDDNDNDNDDRHSDGNDDDDNNDGSGEDPDEATVREAKLGRGASKGEVDRRLVALSHGDHSASVTTRRPELSMADRRPRQCPPPTPTAASPPVPSRVSHVRVDGGGRAEGGCDSDGDGQTQSPASTGPAVSGASSLVRKHARALPFSLAHHTHGTTGSHRSTPRTP